MKNFHVLKNRTLLVTAALVVFLFWHFSSASTGTSSAIERSRDALAAKDTFVNQISGASGGASDGDAVSDDLPFMPKMANETLKAELGQSAWKLFHTILSRYPDEPTGVQKNHLGNYIESFAHVYPCGDCARHFIKILNKYPPQLNSRKNAALWGCFVHNKVNERLNKQIYDCTTILEDYDCGCGTDEQLEDATLNGRTYNEREKSLEEGKDHLGSIKVELQESNIGG